jgi:DNA repair protein RecO (recombination protein O)
MYAIHTTPGFIVSSRPTGEAGKLVSIFTRDLGLVQATALGIRLEKSKLRYHAQDYSFGTFSFVRGKEFWRLTSAETSNGEQRNELIVRIASLLKRLLHGEESHPELFDSLNELKRFLNDEIELKDEQLKTLESLIVLRILNHLGYVGNEPKLAVCFGSNQISTELLNECLSVRSLVNQHINKALRESQV